MSSVVNSADRTKGVGDPCPAYDSMKETWKRVSACCEGEYAVKQFDRDKGLDLMNFSNMLLPFSPTMSGPQYGFLLAEAEWPGVTNVYLKVLLGGLLRKAPKLNLPESLQKGATDWLRNSFGEDGSSMTSFLDRALFDELKTSRAWVFVDHPVIGEGASQEERAAAHPFAVLRQAEEVINWTVKDNKLQRVIVRTYEEVFAPDEFHPDLHQVLHVHELFEGKYRVRIFRKRNIETNSTTAHGQKTQQTGKETFVEDEEASPVLIHGQPLDFIPAWPLNGSIDVQPPLLSTFADKEISLYNKTTRRNHLLYTAATYTPVIFSDIDDTQFRAIVDQGLGTWVHLGKDDKVDVLAPPTEALSDMETAIAKGYEELAKLGIRMLSPETNQSGVALDIRNASQAAQLGTLNAKVSDVLKQVIAFMVYWKTGEKLLTQDVDFSLSEDFNPVPLGADWLRLITEWYERKLIPRSVWLQIMKLNDVIPPEYDDLAATQEINDDELVNDASLEEEEKSSKFDKM
jgi:hypothetical protein